MNDDEGRPAAQPPWRTALSDTLPMGAGMVPLGITFGVLVVHSGLAWWWAPAFSGLIYAGSLEFLLIGLVLTATPLSAIALTTLLVNARHVFYCLSFPLHRVQGRLGRLYARFALIDEAYALTASRPAETFTSRRILWTQAQLHSYWVGGGLLGALLGGVVPASLRGLEFALTALFTVLALEAIKAGAEIRTPILAAACALLSGWLAPGQLLLVAMSAFLAVLALSELLRRAHA